MQKQKNEKSLRTLRLENIPCVNDKMQELITENEDLMRVVSVLLSLLSNEQTAAAAARHIGFRRIIKEYFDITPTFLTKQEVSGNLPETNTN